MSFRAMTWAATVRTNTPTQKLILLLLADRAGDRNTCFPSITRIAEDACVSRKCVIENVKKLAAHGFISVQKRTLKDSENGRGGRSSVYLLHLGRAPLGICGKVVTEGDQGGERGLPSMVNEGYPNLSVESVTEPTAGEEGKTEDKQTEKKAVATADRSSNIYSAEFERFWAAYPNGKNKKGAAQSFAKAIKRAELSVIMDAVRVQSKMKDWTKDGGQYIPMAQTWLNNDRWMDEVAKGDTVFHAVKQDYTGNWINAAGQTREQFEEGK